MQNALRRGGAVEQWLGSIKTNMEDVRFWPIVWGGFMRRDPCLLRGRHFAGQQHDDHLDVIIPWENIGGGKSDHRTF
jgi:hypothetical protein